MSTSSYAAEIQALFYGFDVARILEGMLSELTFGDTAVSIPTYGRRNANSDASYQVDSVNTVTNEKRLNGFSESNRGELEKNNWFIVGYIHGGINAPDGLTEILSIVNLRNLLAINVPRIATEERKKEIRKRIPAENAI